MKKPYFLHENAKQTPIHRSAALLCWLNSAFVYSCLNSIFSEAKAKKKNVSLPEKFGIFFRVGR